MPPRRQDDQCRAVRQAQRKFPEEGPAEKAHQDVPTYASGAHKGSEEGRETKHRIARQGGVDIHVPRAHAAGPTGGEREERMRSAPRGPDVVHDGEKKCRRSARLRLPVRAVGLGRKRGPTQSEERHHGEESLHDDVQVSRS